MSIKAKQSLRGSNNVGDVLKGDPGVTFTPELDEHGNLTWTNDGNLENPATINLKGPKGDPGAPGKSAYEYAQEAGYTGTEEEFAEKLASDKAGASSWNDLEDKPFGETTVKGDTLTWDGNTEGKATLESSEILGYFVKISDAIPVLSDCKNGMTVQTADGAETTYSAGEIDEIYNTIGIVGSQLGAYVIPSDGFVLMDTFTFPESGVWVTYMEDNPYVTSITIPGYNGFETTTIQPIETKYLPEHLHFGETVVKGDTLTWDGNTEGLVSVDFGEFILVKISDAVPTVEDCANGGHIYSINGENTVDADFSSNHCQDVGGIYLITECYSIPNSAAGVDVGGGIAFPEAGFYVLSTIKTFRLTIPGYGGFESKTVTPIDEKYLPDSVKGGGTASAIPDDEMLEFLMDMNIVQPLSNTNNSVFTDTNDKLYVL